MHRAAVSNSTLGQGNRVYGPRRHLNAASSSSVAQLVHFRRRPRLCRPCFARPAMTGPAVSRQSTKPVVRICPHLRPNHSSRACMQRRHGLLMMVMVGEGHNAYHWNPPPQCTIPLKFYTIFGLQQELFFDFGKGNARVSIEL
jgi:hypothetical protein